MTMLEKVGADLKCQNCGVIFNVIFQRNPVYDDIEFCPFCGEEIDGVAGAAENKCHDDR